MSANPTFREAVLFWFKLGWVSFGGPAAQISLMHEEIVERKKWVSEEDFQKGLSFCMILPGPEAHQLATYIGWKLHQRRGALAAGILFLLPSIFILLALSVIYVRWGMIAEVKGVFQGLSYGVIALITVALWKLGRRSIQSPWMMGLAVLAFLGASVGKIHFLWWVVGLLFFSWGKSSFRIQTAHLSISKTWMRTLGVGLLLGLTPLLMVGLWKGFWSLESALGWFFVKVACITFGGAYSILPYVADQSVNHFHWLTASQMMSGMALAETTPGPLIMVLQFVGFMAGWNESGSYSRAVFCSLITTWSTFFPSFIFILWGAPYLHRFQSIPTWERFLQWMSVVVVGLIAAMGFDFLKVTVGGVGFQEIALLVCIGICVKGILKFQWNPWIVILIFAVLGWLLSKL